MATVRPAFGIDDPDALPVLTALDTGHGVPAMAKTWLASEAGTVCRPYDHAWRFRVSALPVTTHARLRGALVALKVLPQACVVRGALLPGADPLCCVRRTADRPEAKATFSDCPRRWLLLDFDKLFCGDFPDPRRDPRLCAEAVRAHLPAALHAVSCFWSFSSSTGMKPDKLGIHLWVLLETPLGWRDAEAFMVACGADVAMSRPVQVHYTARPIFRPPLVDPLDERFGTLEGLDRVPAVVVEELVTRGHQLLAEGRANRRSAVRTTSAPRGRGEGRSRSSEKPPNEAHETAEGMIGDGNRHSHLSTIAGFSRSRGVDAEGLRRLLAIENATHCDPPLADAEILSMARSFARYAVSKVQPTTWASSVSIAAGLMRHDASTDAILAVATHLLGDAEKAQRLARSLSVMPRWMLDCAEVRPDLVLDEEGAP